MNFDLASAIKSERKGWSELVEDGGLKHIPKDAQDLIIEYPPWKLYTNVKDDSLPIRVIGTQETPEGKSVLIIAGCVPNVTTFVNLIRPSELKEVQGGKYTSIKALGALKLNNEGDLFVHPGGWRPLMEMFVEGQAKEIEARALVERQVQ